MKDLQQKAIEALVKQGETCNSRPGSPLMISVSLAQILKVEKRFGVSRLTRIDNDVAFISPLIENKQYLLFPRYLEQAQA